MYLNLLDIPVLIVIAFIAANRSAKKWQKVNPDLWFIVSLGIILIFWLDALLVAVGVLAYPWGLAFCAVRANGWLALLTVLSYPLWYNWGTENALALYGRNPRQEGLIWPFTPEDRSDPFTPAWSSPESEKLL